MISDARFDALAARWEQAFRDAKALSLYEVGSHGAHAEILALAHQALIDEEDPGEYLSRLTASHVADVELRETATIG